MDSADLVDSAEVVQLWLLLVLQVPELELAQEGLEPQVLEPQVLAQEVLEPQVLDLEQALGQKQR